MKKIFISLFTVLVTFSMITSTSARELAEAGESIVQEGSYDSLRLVAGQTVTNKADIDGLSLIAGETLDLQGSAPYGFYAGKNVTINEKISKDMFVAGETITIGESAVIGRDVYAAGSSVIVKSNIGRDLRVGAGKLDLSNVTVGGDVYAETDRIILNENTVITGTLVYPEEASVDGLDSATIGSIEKQKHVEAVEVEVTKNNTIDVIVGMIAAFLTLVALFYIIPKSKDELDNTELSVGSVLKAIGFGLLVLIVVPIVSLIALFTAILTPLAFISIAVYVISIYIATLLLSYIVGHLINEKLIKNDNMYLSLLIGIVVVKIVKMLPVLGGLVSALGLFYGLGLIFKFITKREK